MLKVNATIKLSFEAHSDSTEEDLVKMVRQHIADGAEIVCEMDFTNPNDEAFVYSFMNKDENIRDFYDEDELGELVIGYVYPTVIVDYGYDYGDFSGLYIDNRLVYQSNNITDEDLEEYQCVAVYGVQMHLEKYPKCREYLDEHGGFPSHLTLSEFLGLQYENLKDYDDKFKQLFHQ
jgi:hypothetical protein